MKIKILLLAANPKETHILRLAEEFRNIKESIQRAKYRDIFHIEQGGAIRPKDLRRLILDESPHIIHFSGHGESDNIYLENDEGSIQPVTNEALKELLSLFDSVSCVVLNSCYSKFQADYLKDITPYIVGMRSSISDKSAVMFSGGFYDALGSGRSIEDSFKFGLSSINLNDPKEKNSSRSAEIEKEYEENLIPVLIKGNITRNLPKLTLTSWFSRIRIRNINIMKASAIFFKEEKYSKSRRNLLLSVFSISAVSFIYLFRGKKLSKFIPLSIKHPKLIKNKITSAVHHIDICKDHLPLIKNINNVSFSLSYNKLHKLGGSEVLKEVLNSLSDKEKEVFILEAIKNNPTSTHLYKWLISLYGKNREYDKIHSLLNKNIQYLISKERNLNSKKLKKQYKKAIVELKARRDRANFLA